MLRRILTMVGMHPWDVTPQQAKAIQDSLREQIITEDRFGKIGYVAGVDLGYDLKHRLSRAAVVVLGFPGLDFVEQAVATCPTSFPYVPGLLSFRELPAALEALGKLRTQPDMILCDGQGYAHPRRFGLACHLGLWLDKPTIGVAKSRLIGSHGTLPEHKGATVPLMDGDEQIGVVLRSRAGVRPLYISIGHRISLATAVDYVMACVTRYRLPETTRRADRLASGGKALRPQRKKVAKPKVAL